jgi:hypothetical protein
LEKGNLIANILSLLRKSLHGLSPPKNFTHLPTHELTIRGWLPYSYREARWVWKLTNRFYIFVLQRVYYIIAYGWGAADYRK